VDDEARGSTGAAAGESPHRVAARVGHPLLHNIHIFYSLRTSSTSVVQVFAYFSAYAKICKYLIIVTRDILAI
jgi:hypothetical protein